MPRGKVIPGGWAAYHRPVANGTMTATLTIYAPDTSTYDEDARMNVPSNGTERWSGKGRIQQHNFESNFIVGGQEIRSRAYLVAVDAEVNNVEVNDVVRVSSLNDQDLFEMVVMSVEKGSERFQRDLICLDVQQLNLYRAST